MRICKIVPNNLKRLQDIAFENGIKWYGRGTLYYEECFSVVIVIFLNHDKKLYLQRCDDKEYYINKLKCPEVTQEYFEQNIKKLVEKYK